MTRSISVFSLLCLAFLAATARAQADDMSARLAAAADLLEAMGGRQSIMQQIDRVIPLQMQQLQAQFPNMTPETRRIVEQSMRQEMSNGVNALLTQMAAAWARRFSENDLRQIASFHRSPAGQRLRAQQEELAREIAEIGRNWGADIGRRVQERIQQQLKGPNTITS
jgi:hypothetical protein